MIILKSFHHCLKVKSPLVELLFWVSPMLGLSTALSLWPNHSSGDIQYNITLLCHIVKILSTNIWSQHKFAWFFSWFNSMIMIYFHNLFWSTQITKDQHLFCLFLNWARLFVLLLYRSMVFWGSLTLLTCSEYDLGFLYRTCPC